jgi:hypothetical protein
MFINGYIGIPKKLLDEYVNNLSVFVETIDYQ